MAGITDEKHIVEAGLALCAALRAVGRDPQAAEQHITEAEIHLNAVRTPNKPKADKPADVKKGKE